MDTHTFAEMVRGIMSEWNADVGGDAKTFTVTSYTETTINERVWKGRDTVEMMTAPSLRDLIERLRVHYHAPLHLVYSDNSVTKYHVRGTLTHPLPVGQIVVIRIEVKS